MKKSEVDKLTKHQLDLLRVVGHHGMFASRKTLGEAGEYAQMMLPGVEHMTGMMVYVNTLAEQLTKILTPEQVKQLAEMNGIELDEEETC